MKIPITPENIDDTKICYHTDDNRHFLFDVSATTLFEITADALNFIKGKDLSGMVGSDVETEYNELRACGKFSDFPNKSERSLKKDVLPLISEITFGITHTCNFDCNYCFGTRYKSYNGEGEDDRTVLRVGMRCLNILADNMARDLAKGGTNNGQVYSIIFFGGEPLIKFNLIKELVAYGRHLFRDHLEKLSFGITTNASLLSEEVIEFFIENEITPLISIDGAKQVNDTYRKFIDGNGTFNIVAKKLKMAKDLGLPFGARMTITSTCPDVEMLIDETTELGFFSYKLVQISGKDEMALRSVELSRLKDSYFRLAKRFVELVKRGSYVPFDDFNHYLKSLFSHAIQEIGCGIGIYGVSVTPTGDVVSCYKLSGEKEAMLGSIFQEKLIVSRPGVDYAENVNKIKLCKKCEIKYICGGGCFADLYFSVKENCYNCFLNHCRIKKWLFLLSIWIVTQFEGDSLKRLHEFVERIV